MYFFYWLSIMAAFTVEIKYGHIVVSLEHNLSVNGFRFWFLHYIALINVRFCAFIRPLMFNLLSTPRKVREQKQECECVCVCVCVRACVCVRRDWRGPRVWANQRRVSLMSFQRTEHRLFNWLQTACLLIAAGIQTRVLCLRYADPLARDIWILNSSTSSTKTAGLLCHLDSSKWHNLWIFPNSNGNKSTHFVPVSMLKHYCISSIVMCKNTGKSEMIFYSCRH